MLQLSVRLPYIALMPWLQEVESACQVQYTVQQWESFSEERVKSHAGVNSVIYFS